MCELCKDICFVWLCFKWKTMHHDSLFVCFHNLSPCQLHSKKQLKRLSKQILYTGYIVYNGYQQKQLFCCLTVSKHLVGYLYYYKLLILLVFGNKTIDFWHLTWTQKHFPKCSQVFLHKLCYFINNLLIFFQSHILLDQIITHLAYGSD